MSKFYCHSGRPVRYTDYDIYRYTDHNGNIIAKPDAFTDTEPNKHIHIHADPGVHIHIYVNGKPVIDTFGITISDTDSNSDGPSNIDTYEDSDTIQKSLTNEDGNPIAHVGPYVDAHGIAHIHGGAVIDGNTVIVANPDALPDSYEYQDSLGYLHVVTNGIAFIYPPGEWPAGRKPHMD